MKDDLAIVMTGGGARAAYQVGHLKAIARRFPDLRVPIYTGVSAGAINAAHLAAHTGNFAAAVLDLEQLWAELTAEHVFRLTLSSALSRAVRFGWRFFSGGHGAGPPPRGLVDTGPLWKHLEGTLSTSKGDLLGVDFNLRHGSLKALAITTTCYTTGQTVTWVQGDDIPDWERPNRRSRRGTLRLHHVMASSALPFFFPAVDIDGKWYGDGGMRLTAPLSPAVHLGAARILTISTRYNRSRAEADRPVVFGYPPPGQVAGLVLNAIFLDHLDGDALQMQRINALLEECPEAGGGMLRPLRVLVNRPSRDLGAMANDYEPRLPGTFRYMTRGLSSPGARANDFLSLVMFQPDYLQALIALGERDAEARFGEIEELLADRD